VDVMLQEQYIESSVMCERLYADPRTLAIEVCDGLVFGGGKVDALNRRADLWRSHQGLALVVQQRSLLGHVMSTLAGMVNNIQVRTMGHFDPESLSPDLQREDCNIAMSGRASGGVSGGEGIG
jgi:hypothetical protein